MLLGSIIIMCNSVAKGGSKDKEDEDAGGTGAETDLKRNREKSEFAIMSLNFSVAMATMQTSVLGSP